MFGQTTGQSFWCKMGERVRGETKVLIPPGLVVRHSASQEIRTKSRRILSAQ